MFAAMRERIEHLLRWIALAAVIGAISGLASAAFIGALNWSTSTRASHDWLIWLLPIAGLVVGAAYHYVGKGLERGSNLVIDQLHEHSEWIPLRMPLLVFGASVVTHLAGGSAGREGAAVQIASGFADPLAKRFGFTQEQRSLFLVAAIAGGFGSVFGVPIAGMVFALEVQRIGRVRYEAIVPALTASIIGDAVVRAVGIHHTVYPRFVEQTWNWPNGWRLCVLGIMCGLVASLFVRSTHAVKSLLAGHVSWYPLRPVIGGTIVMLLVVVFSWRQYSGLSIDIAVDAMNGSNANNWIPKLLLTAITMGCGFVGGEVIPLVVTGSLLGQSVAGHLGLDRATGASLASMAVLGAAANTPLAVTVMGLELFGGSGIAMFALVSITAYAVSGHRGIYHAQRVSAHKSGAA